MTQHLPSTLPPFWWATGIENTFVPQVRPGLRALDEYKLTQHDKFWKEDFDKVADLGVQALRWGIPWYQVQPKPDTWDWRWTDEALDYLVNVKGITPIIDLMHYGTPLWLDNSFINSRYPQLVAAYAQAVAERYGSLVRYYTPLNEPMINADLSGQRGDWPPYLTGDDGYVRVALALARGMVLTTQAIRAAQPAAVTIQVEALWYVWTRFEALAALAEQANARQFLCFDLAIGRVDDNYPLADYLAAHGATPAELAWFRANAVNFDIFGANFYPWSYVEWRPRKNGLPQRVPRRTHGEKLAEVIRTAYGRYAMPIMVTETSAKRDIDGRAHWMDQTIEAVCGLRQQGLPVIGYTWFPFFSMVDWAYRRGRRPLSQYLIHLGLYDAAFDETGTFQRHATPLVARYQQHIARPMPPISEQ
jgi:beta-glucosidase/6-phospho-beta-glucosidase/beta-galactosidase